ncbi:hypothetical protein CDAR_506641 [Caerostris darwini]|uniref:Secreted protein n=1 Tax=Caerostris darwini TaxID=1538125 RepID=A0AAV4QH55_9ARAC|nr:hypothetical protein CDAR_506641 [Caerostris darwini]
MPLTLFASVTLSVALVLSSDRRPLQHRRVLVEKQFDFYLYSNKKEHTTTNTKQTILKTIDGGKTVEEQLETTRKDESNTDFAIKNAHPRPYSNTTE